MPGPKIKTLDIETSPITAYVWRTFKENVSIDQIVRDWSILSFCAKDLGKRAVRYMDVSEKADPYDDYAIMQALWKELDEADIIIVQNGIKFDLRKINARLLALGFPPPRPYKLVDTMLEARKIAAMTSNKLEWLSAVLTDAPKDKHKEFPGFSLWAECLKGNKKAWRVMRKYNPQDVRATEKVYLRLRPYIVGHPNVAAYYEDEKRRCPKCGSTRVEQEGFHYTQVSKYPRYKCGACGGWSRGRYTISSKEKRKSLLSN